MGFGVGVIQSTGLSVAVRVAPKERLGLANSTFYIFVDIGVGIGPVIYGLFVPFTGYRGVYIIVIVISVICAFLYYFIHGRNVSSNSENIIVIDTKKA